MLLQPGQGNFALDFKQYPPSGESLDLFAAPPLRAVAACGGDAGGLGDPGVDAGDVGDPAHSGGVLPGTLVGDHLVLHVKPPLLFEDPVQTVLCLLYCRQVPASCCSCELGAATRPFCQERWSVTISCCTATPARSAGDRLPGCRTATPARSARNVGR